MQRFFYNLLILLLIPLIFFKFSNGFFSRLRINKKFKKCIWLHCASLGEINALMPFINELKQQQIPLVISTFTASGFKKAKEIKGVNVIYLPLDIPFIIRGFLRKLNPKKIFIAETEIWPNLLNECFKQQIPIYLVNARLSEKSLNKYLRFAPKFFLNDIKNITHIYAQSEVNKQRFLKLGVNKNKLTNMGNLKFNISVDKEKELSIKKQYENINRTILVMGSVRTKEVDFLIDTFKQLKEFLPDLLLIIAPRHLQVCELIIKIAYKKELSLSLRTDNKFIDEDILLLDTLGELQPIYSIADVVFIGGSLFKQYGGHNVIEAALFKAPVVVGKYMDNSLEIVELFKEKEAIIQVKQNELMAELLVLLKDKTKCKQINTNAKQVIADNKADFSKLIDNLL
ncbi:3-deoxy-D-manno-octulosonic-acid transferase [hydrothermal vent metagenome]|uniref:3-deoxy-D-manno-octulosonic-acid transferase n=1 Tax=hydrothermal vent metagenome TaxID=652676 RepID=A0A1W1CN65_9ZZZZ